MSLQPLGYAGRSLFMMIEIEYMATLCIIMVKKLEKIIYMLTMLKDNLKFLQCFLKFRNDKYHFYTHTKKCY